MLKNNGRMEFSVSINDAQSNFYRKFFIQGQADYRAGFSMDISFRDNASAVEAWNMGWQADAEVERRGLKLSNLGVIVPKPLDLEYVEDIEDLI